MYDIFALSVAAIGFILLIILSVIDFKTYLLPNKYVFPFAGLGVLFHFLSDFYLLDLTGVLLGGAVGYGVLYLIRAAGNHYYEQDSLGLGDVKLLGAGGLWLGMEGVLMAMTIGAFLGLCFGFAVALYKKVKNSEKFSLARLTIPAGPGFAVAIIIVFAWNYYPFILRTFS
ncbi:MAG: A24 family peptidase [Pseudomonadota bacterium]